MKGFEERLERLEEISELIRDGKLPIENALELFEEGMKLSKSLEKELTRIERRVEVLTNQPETAEDTPVFELFPELGEQ